MELSLVEFAPRFRGRPASGTLDRSGHNQFWFWGLPASRGNPLIIVSDAGENCGGGLDREQVLSEQLPKIPYALPADNGHTLWICRSLSSPLRTLPPSVRHFE